MSTLSDENVCRLDVAVHDARSVSGVERVSNVDRNGEKNFPFQGPPANAMLKRQAVQKLHGQEERAVFLPNLMDRADIGMVEGGSGASFAAETFQCLGILRPIVGEKLKGDKSTQRDVFGLVNHAHATAAEFLDDAVVRDGTPDHARPIIFLRSLVENLTWVKPASQRTAPSWTLRAATTLMAARPNTHTVLRLSGI